MAEIGVFRSKSGLYYTCCCRAMIPHDYEDCPRCKNRVIPIGDRYDFTVGEENKARQARFIDRYMASGKYEAGKVAARLKGKIFVMPHLCSYCGNPQPECECIPTEW